VFDSLGNKLSLSIVMRKTANLNEWSWAADAGAPTTITGGRSGKILFNSDGTLKAFSFDDGSTAMSLSPNNGASDMQVGLNIGTPGTFSGITQADGQTSVTPRGQDGYGSGVMNNISIDQTGRIQGTFSNGTVLTLGQVLLAEFNNPGGLVKAGENMYDISGNSGAPAIVAAGESSSSAVISGTLEQSNVDLSEEFTRMITAQRGFQANARIITTSDEFLNEVVNLKR
jgi:flagellar hook protein FlgE